MQRLRASWGSFSSWSWATRCRSSRWRRCSRRQACLGLPCQNRGIGGSREGCRGRGVQEWPAGPVLLPYASLPPALLHRLPVSSRAPLLPHAHPHSPPPQTALALAGSCRPCRPCLQQPHQTSGAALLKGGVWVFGWFGWSRCGGELQPLCSVRLGAGTHDAAESKRQAGCWMRDPRARPPLQEAERLAEEKGWAVASDGDSFRRVVASPLPKEVVEWRAVQTLLQVCSRWRGGGGLMCGASLARHQRIVRQYRFPQPLLVVALKPHAPPAAPSCARSMAPCSLPACGIHASPPVDPLPLATLRRTRPPFFPPPAPRPE